MTFTRIQWQEAAAITTDLALDDCFYMRRFGLAVSNGSHTNTVYTLTCIDMAECPQASNLCASDPYDSDAYTSIRVTLCQLCSTGSEREKRVALNILEMLDAGITTFTYEDWAKRFRLSKSANHEDLRTAVNHDLVISCDDGFRICKQVDPDRRYSTFTKMLRDTLNRLISIFPSQPFVVQEAAERLGMKSSTMQYHLEQLVQKNILRYKKFGNKPHKYNFTEDYLQSVGPMNNGRSPGDEAVARYAPGLVAGGASGADSSVRIGFY